MKYPLILLLIVCCLMACDSTDKSFSLDLADMYDKYHLEGCFLLKSLKSGELYVYNPNRCERGFIPASTFKIVNSIAALETGIAPDENLLIKWDSSVRQIAAWNQDHTMKTAFQVSCVPYYQEVARRIGALRMQEWVNKLKFGKMDIREENIDDFWLKGNSSITPYQQLDFIERLANNQLPIQASTHKKVKEIMVLASDDSGMIMRGKTGWGIVGDKNIGWFVGFIERPDGERFVFVNNIESKVEAMEDNVFMMCRKNIVGEVLKKLGVI